MVLQGIFLGIPDSAWSTGKLLGATSDLLNSNSMSFTTSRQTLMNLEHSDGEITSRDLDEEDTA